MLIEELLKLLCEDGAGEKRSPLKDHDIKVIFNNPATIVIIDGKKYVSKAHIEDFDEEKGLLICLAKSQGISYQSIKNLVKSAKNYRK